ncbi:hypothetical protein BDB00DRAFT_877316 [Zychaea mexicana]|uniref:uncharacterized protein n=1 Tax=Zychaea mexicana TaxID=64656 RepID=UPI0022FE5A66|nr:uncharacterized protein BDB00DRAFT_877316 [Zychaea mexicana]KAI9488530.1 hypothetical protein BDB00DRAFT_877316 [Zychaea mexicana]
MSSRSSSSQVPGLNDASSPEELAALLKKTYATLRSKEKDLKLAAELGWSLMDNNLELKAKHDFLLQQRRNSPELIVKPSTSILTRSRDTHENASQWLQRVDSPGGFSDDSNNSTMRLIPRQQAHDAIVQMLTEKNRATQASLDSTLADLNAARIAGGERVQLLKDEMVRLQQQLDAAAQTIETIEHQRREETQRPRTESPLPVDATDVELLAQIDELEAENQRLLATKTTAQTKLNEATQNLSRWQQEVANYEAMDDQYKKQQAACQRQADEITRLTGAVEEYRSQLARYCDHSMAEPDNDNEKVLVQHPTDDNGLRPPTLLQPSISTQTNLLSELERAWTKELEQVPLATITTTTPASITSVKLDRPQASQQKQQYHEQEHYHHHHHQQQQQQSPLSVNNDGMSLTNEYVSLLPNEIRDAWAKELDAVHPLMTRMPSNKHYSSVGSRSATTDADYPTYDPPSPAASISCPPSFHPPSVKHCYAGAESIYAQLSGSGVTGGRGKAFMATTYQSRRSRPSYHHHHQYQQSSFLVMVIQKIWGWYRFSLILFLAVLINLWQGPDAILEK